jgi:hypothetical protein
MLWRSLLPSLALGVFCAGCSRPVVLEHAQVDLRCPQDAITVETLHGSHLLQRRNGLFGSPDKVGEYGIYSAEGCGKRIVYFCNEWDTYNQVPICDSRLP